MIRPRHVSILLPVILAASLLPGGVAGPAGVDRSSGDRPAGEPTEPTRLRLAEFAFDPVAGTPDLPAGWDRSSATGPDLHLVQLHGLTRDEQLAKLEQAGVEIVQYIHPHTYVVWGPRSAREAAGRESFVRWTGDFAPAYRVQPQWRDLGPATQSVRVLIYRKAGADGVVQAIAAMGGQLQVWRQVDRRFDVAGFDLPGDRIQGVASLPGVYTVQLEPTSGGLRGEMSDQVNVNNVDAGNAAFPGYPAWLAGVGVDGSGVVIANVDGGVLNSHPDLVGRLLGCTGDTCGGGATSSHGTHTAGIMAADGSSGTLDSFGFLRGLGVAPGANLVEQVYSPTFTQPGGMLKLMTDSYRNGAALSGNSWGPSGFPQGYDNDTLQVDVGVRDADPDQPGNQPLSYVLSFMNGNGGTSTQGSPDEAKNIFTIGSTKMQNFDGSQILDIDDLSSNSAHGPALDGREIPHMVAPGCRVDSTDTTGSQYGLKCGTSMASPHVAGAVALFIEYYRGLPDSTADPSPALVKAAFLAVARDLAGNRDADGGTLGHPFDSKQGWGRMDLEAVVDPAPGSVRYFDQEVLLDATGESWSTTLSPLDPGQPVRVMLVWTDAPGHGLGGSTPAWNNDLDLEVVDGPDVYLGNNFGADGWSTPGGSPDFRNNTEGVLLATPPSSFEIRVVARNITSDGVPNAGDATDQDFALVCVNCAAEPTFGLDVTPATQEVCAPDDAAFDVQVGQTLGFADPVTLAATGLPAGATAAFSVNPVVPEGASTLTVGGTGGLAGGEYAFEVEGTAGAILQSEALAFTVREAAPEAVTVVSPAGGALVLTATPALSWTAAAEVSGYEVQVATDPTFLDVVYSASETGTSHVIETPLALDDTYYWRVLPWNGCGTPGYSAAATFMTPGYPPVLLVDDDDNTPDVRDAYTGALDALGVAYDVWDTDNSDFEPDQATLSAYRTVIWFTGDEVGGAAGPGAAAETALDAWLDTSRCLLVASQDYHADRGLTGFMQSRLGVASVGSDVDISLLKGEDLWFGYGPYTPNEPYTDRSDTLAADATAGPGFLSDQGVSALLKDGGLYRTSFWGFGLEVLPSAGDREVTLGAFMGWCEELLQLDDDTDGTANGADCAPADGDVWAEPQAAAGLAVAADGSLGWSAPAEPGATAVTYDVLRAGTAAGLGAATCVASGVAMPVATDVEEPPPGEVFFYAVRVQNGCGTTLGQQSDGTPRVGVDCP